MANKELLSRLADIPIAKPGFDALGMSAPVLVQMNPEGKWENSKPQSMDEDKLKAVVQHLVNSRAVSAAQSYCCQCAAENQKESGSAKSNYVPVIMMPIYPADQCPFDIECEIQKLKDTESKPKAVKKKEELAKNKDNKDNKKKGKERGFVMQRLTDFDLLSQW